MNTPILFIIFNRPDSTAQVFEQIRKIRPARLFVAADAPRYPIKNDPLACSQALQIATNVDWDCELKILKQETNLGVAKGGAAAISWFFTHVEEGIILEDDCVPNEDFFIFCKQALEQYRNDPSVMMIAGTSYYFGSYSGVPVHYKSKHYAIWGWACWRRAWNLYDFRMLDWRVKIKESDVFHFWGDKRIAKNWIKIFDSIVEGKLEAWDAQWIFACLKNRGYAVSVPFNMISNIGLIGGHANGNRSPFHEMPYQQFDVTAALKTLLSPLEAEVFDRRVYQTVGFLQKEKKVRSFIGKVIRRIPLAKKVYEFIKNH